MEDDYNLFRMAQAHTADRCAVSPVFTGLLPSYTHLLLSSSANRPPSLCLDIQSTERLTTLWGCPSHVWSWKFLELQPTTHALPSGVTGLEFPINLLQAQHTQFLSKFPVSKSLTPSSCLEEHPNLWCYNTNEHQVWLYYPREKRGSDPGSQCQIHL